MLSEDGMKIRILFDKDGLDDRFKTGWGISYLIDDDILFDTGEKFEYLENNARLMDADLQKIRKIVLSCNRWEHIGGLWELLQVNRDITVYSCVDFDKKFGEKAKNLGVKLVKVRTSLKISDNIYSTGQILAYEGERQVLEQSLVVNTGKKLALICGCSQVGVLNIIGQVRKIFKKDVSFILGGFHLMDEERRVIKYLVDQIVNLGIEKVGPSHCTGFEGVSLLKEVFSHNFIGIEVGREIEL